MTRMTRDYVVAQRASYRPQEKVVIPKEKLRKIVEIPLGFQPLGIASQSNRVVIAAYFKPAVCLVKVSQTEKGLALKLEWIREVLSGGEKVRLFPDTNVPGGANRAQTVNLGPGETLWVSRNTGREFFVLIPHPALKGQWVLGERILLPGSEAMVHSALLTGKTILTVESPLSLQEWRLCEYEINSQTGEINLSDQISLPPWMYGIGIARKGDEIWLVADFRATEAGIFRKTRDGKLELVVPDVRGNGICFLEDGAALVSRYGQGHPNPFGGVPGALLYVPSSLLK